MKTFRTLLVLLLILNLGWALTWTLVCLISNGWFPDLFIWRILLGIPAIYISIVLLILNIIAAIASPFWWIVKKKLNFATMLPLVIVIVVYYLGAKIPSKPEVTFYLHREGFDRTVESVANGFPDLDENPLRLPDSPLYEMAWAYRDFTSGELAIEFIIGKVHLPLVYVSTDNPDDVLAICSQGPVKKLEPNWYVCKLDWDYNSAEEKG